jgi:hypothetical protein
MSAIEKIVAELDALLKRGMKLLNDHKKGESSVNLAVEYEPWYTLALSLIRQIVPERLADFQHAYKQEKRKEITFDTYTVADYLIGLVITRAGSPVFDTHVAYQMKFLGQIAILRAAGETAVSVLRDVRSVLRAELFDDDIDAARDLVKKGHLRSAGVISGVVLEGHLKSVAARRSIKFTKKNLTISDLNDGLRNGTVYDVPTWRFIQRLGDIRNLCGHAGDRDPTKRASN